MLKRPATLDGFFTSPASKRARVAATDPDCSVVDESRPTSKHSTYPFAIRHLPSDIVDLLSFSPASDGRLLDDQPHLDLVYYQPYIPKDIQRPLFDFLRSELFFYRVKYSIKRGPTETNIVTPRFTTVFGLDETSVFTEDGTIVDALSKKPVPSSAYRCKPRPLPQCLDVLRQLTQNATGCEFNFALVNYYASGEDSISYHSDDERFLGPDPAIASFSLGARRDFLMRHKKTPAGHPSERQPMKMPLGPGDMILMRGQTQSNWEHSIPKRKGPAAGEGRINITFRRAKVKGGTENYYRYNVGDGQPLRWDESARDMLPHGGGLG